MEQTLDQQIRDSDDGALEIWRRHPARVEMMPHAVYLDTITPLHATVGYGDLGTAGELGYEDKVVTVRQQVYAHALSTHPPARIAVPLGGQFTRFTCTVALNDDVAARRTHADFRVLADGRPIALASFVVAGEPPRSLHADVSGVERLELVVTTSQWEYCHAVWLDPLVSTDQADPLPRTLLDCLERVEITLPPRMPHARRCIATTVSPGFATLLDDMLGSLLANGCCTDALLAVFAVDPDDACRQVAEKYAALLISCTRRAQVNATVKSVLYSAAQVINADYFLCLDADMLVLGDLSPIFATLEACPDATILACREGNGPGYANLEHALTTVYGGRRADIARLTGAEGGEAAYPLVVNDGTFAGGSIAMHALDGLIRSWKQAPVWVDERRNIWWRNQFIFNLALAQSQCGVELHPTYNVQLNSEEAEMGRVAGRPQALWRGQSARVLHFNGLGRHKYPDWRGLFARVDRPLVGRGKSDGYTAFLCALRTWVGQRGLNALTWSFYGTADARSAQVHDAEVLPLFAVLYYLIRANGCTRVLETGTARGVSAACLASAVVHRVDGQVVTFDPCVYPEREDLWAALPDSIHACIESRATDSCEGMTAALARGEQYDAALLDSLHTEEHVWAEFSLATQLVCSGGLILIHDACLPDSTVPQALRRIEAAGYGVTRLWTADRGEQEDDGLGLAVIENRPRAVGSV